MAGGQNCIILVVLSRNLLDGPAFIIADVGVVLDDQTASYSIAREVDVTRQLRDRWLCAFRITNFWSAVNCCDTGSGKIADIVCIVTSRINENVGDIFDDLKIECRALGLHRRRVVVLDNHNILHDVDDDAVPISSYHIVGSGKLIFDTFLKVT